MTTPPLPNPQFERLRAARIRAYQTYIIFRKARLAKRGLKWLTFLGNELGVTRRERDRAREQAERRYPPS